MSFDSLLTGGLIPVMILVFFYRTAIAVRKQLDRIKVLLGEIRDQQPGLDNPAGKCGLSSRDFARRGAEIG